MTINTKKDTVPEFGLSTSRPFTVCFYEGRFLVEKRTRLLTTRREARDWAGECYRDRTYATNSVKLYDDTSSFQIWES